MLKFIC